MPEPFTTISDTQIDLIRDMITAAQTDAAVKAAWEPTLVDLAPTEWEQLSKVIAFTGRVTDLILYEGAPPADLGLVNAVLLDTVNKRLYGPKTVAGWGVGITYGDHGRSLENIFPNDRWQLLNGLGPGWDGDPGSLAAHLLAFDTEWNSDYTGNFAAVNVTNIAVATDGTSGQNTITATCDDVQYCYPGQLIAFGASGAHASLLVSAMRILTVNVTAQTVTFKAPWNGSPTTGAVTCAFRPVMRADMAGVTGNGPDGWTKTAGAHCWIDRFPLSTTGITGTVGWTSNLRPSNKRILVFRPTSDSAQHFYHTFPDPVSLRGQTISFGFMVNRVSNGTAKLFVGGTDYVEGSQTVSTAGWTWMEMAYTVPDDCTELQAGIVFENSNADPWQIVDPMCAVGATIGEGGYRPAPRGTLQRFIVKQTPDSFHGADITFPSVGSGSVGYGFEVDIYAGTVGAIAEDVPMIRGQIEGAAATVTPTGRALVVRSTFAAPHRYGLIAHCPVANYVGGVTGDFDLASDGTFWLSTNAASEVWANISLDLNAAILSL